MILRGLKRSFGRQKKGGFLLGKNWFKSSSNMPQNSVLNFDASGEDKIKRMDGEDIHSYRYRKLSGEGEQFSGMVSDSMKNFHFNQAHLKTKPVYLDDVNIIGEEDSSTFYKVPYLAHELEHVVKNPGIYPAEEISKLLPDGGEFLKRIPQVEEIDFDRIPPYTPPSQDEGLLKFARDSNSKYIMSTSTISSALSQLYFQFSSYKAPDFDLLSSDYETQPFKYMISHRKPVTNIIQRIDKENDIYAFDSDYGLFANKETILMGLGKVMERQFTMTREEFESQLVKGKIDYEQPLLEEDHHRFMKVNNNICLRSQIDCTAKLEDGSQIVFEIKTRSVSPIRYDLDNYQDYLDYTINTYRGIHSSYEREYYDLIRGGFMKYCFQLKIGRMSGAFISYHNTVENFGFEYVTTEEIERRIFGSSHYADLSFVVCSKLLTTLMDEVLEAVKEEDYGFLRLGTYADGATGKIVIFAELFYDEKKWTEDMLATKSDEVSNEYEYYQNFYKGKRKVLKFDFHIFTYVNGIIQTNADFNFSETDQFEVRYYFEQLGEASNNDYMNFLHEAYKMDSYTLDMSYVGTWIQK